MTQQDLSVSWRGATGTYYPAPQLKIKVKVALNRGVLKQAGE